MLNPKLVHIENSASACQPDIFGYGWLGTGNCVAARTMPLLFYERKCELFSRWTGASIHVAVIFWLQRTKLKSQWKKKNEAEIFATTARRSAVFAILVRNASRESGN